MKGTHSKIPLARTWNPCPSEVPSNSIVLNRCCVLPPVYFKSHLLTWCAHTMKTLCTHLPCCIWETKRNAHVYLTPTQLTVYFQSTAGCNCGHEPWGHGGPEAASFCPFRCLRMETLMETSAQNCFGERGRRKKRTGLCSGKNTHFCQLRARGKRDTHGAGISPLLSARNQINSLLLP